MTMKRAMLAVGAMLGVYLLLAVNYGRQISATYDEPLHLVAAHVIREAGDFRVNPEDPPLFELWAGLALRSGSLAPDYRRPEWVQMLEYLPRHWSFCNAAMYSPAAVSGMGVDPVAVLWQARVMMLGVSLALGVVTTALAWTIARGWGGTQGMGDLGARWAAVLAAAAFALEPTLLGHGMLVKNDMALGLAFAICALAVARMWGGVRKRDVALLALGGAIGVCTKFSGLLLAPLVLGALGVRALCWGRACGEWSVLGWEAKSVAGRLAGVLGIGVTCVAVTFVAVWGVYGFRYSMGPGGVVAPLEPELIMTRTHLKHMQVRDRQPAEAEVDAVKLPMPLRLVAAANEARVLPNAWCKGFLYTYATTRLRTSYLFSELSEFGRWYYFPVTLGLKLPLGSLGLLAASAGLMGWGWYKGRRGLELATWCGWGPAIIAAAYFGLAMMGNLNIGIRHLIPAMPLAIALAVQPLARLMAQPKRGADEIMGSAAASETGLSEPGFSAACCRRWMRVVAVLGLGVALETMANQGKLIAFFNLPARWMGPERLLADSNLDWGQDLPKLVEWQQRHPEVQLTGLLFGSWSAEAYGLRYVPLQVTEYPWTEPQQTVPPGVLAVSASWLQELFFLPANRGNYGALRQLKPREVLGGGTIFLYDMPSRGELREKPWRLRWWEGGQLHESPPR